MTHNLSSIKRVNILFIFTALLRKAIGPHKIYACTEGKNRIKNTLISNNNSLVGRAMIKERKTELVEGFRHSVPYINTHRGKTFVIMLGGEAIEHDNFFQHR